jgi:hypothetical protein
MKILEDKYPMGTIPGQKTAGRYVDGILHENIKFLAKNIVNDMTFLGICSSSTLEVGTGKSSFIQQLGEDYTDQVNKIHKLNITFDINNIVFRPKELIERAFKVPKYSCLILDEWEDAHYWSELGMSLRQFFRKCRQLNLFIIIIIPNFFQLPIPYAVSRSVFFIDVRFEGEFERGYFSFYNFEKKKELYIKGKKFMNYHVVKPDFYGRFTKGYAVDEEVYKKAKFNDMIDSEKRTQKPTEREIKIKIFKQLHLNHPEIPIKVLVNSFGVDKRTAFNWLNEDGDTGEDTGVSESEVVNLI